MLATATAPPVVVVALRVAFGAGDFATRESSCTSTAPLTIAAAADVTSIGAGIDDLARSKPVTVVRPNSAVCLVSSAGTAATAATDVTYVDKTPGSISTPSTASSIARVAAADTAAVAFSREQLDERALVERRAAALASLCARERARARAEA